MSNCGAHVPPPWLRCLPRQCQRTCALARASAAEVALPDDDVAFAADGAPMESRASSSCASTAIQFHFTYKLSNDSGRALNPTISGVQGRLREKLRRPWKPGRPCAIRQQQLKLGFHAAFSGQCRGDRDTL
eukprot:360988-Chlamydomonas_euryale.AAC.7